MRTIPSKKIRDAVALLCARANLVLRQDVLSALKKAYKKETDRRAKKIILAIIENADVARYRRLAICQDTGIPSVFVRIGQEVSVKGGLSEAINAGVAAGYRRASLRSSIVKDPLKRGKPGFSPAVIHYDIVKGRKLEITLLPKGFGCENKSVLRMFNPTATTEEIVDFIVDTVRCAGPDACPPYVVGVGIGGTADYAVLMSKKSLLNRIDGRKGALEKLLLERINKLNIGPMGLGGRTTALGVGVLQHPTHIAGLPVAVSLSCHALRSAKITI